MSGRPTELICYCGSDTARWGWQTVAVAAALTLALFLFLPFADLVAGRTESPLLIRAVGRTVHLPPRTEPEPARPPAPQPRPQQPLPDVPAPPLQLLAIPQALPRLQPPPLPSMPQVPATALRVPAVAALPLTDTTAVGTAPSLGMDLGLAFAVQPGPASPPPPTVAPPEAYDLDQLDQAPSPLRQIHPSYPSRARARELTGYVDLRFLVTESGLVEGIQVIDAVPGEVFVDAATRAVSRWRFTPGRRHGKPVPVRMQIRLRFELE